MSQQNYRDTLPEGYRLHWFELQTVLGRGGYGITYLALDKNLERRVAIKEYLPLDFAARHDDDTVRPLTGEHGEMYQWGLERFLKEARTLARFSRPNIVRVLSVFESNNTAYMVMEYEHGKDLSTIYKSKDFFPEEELLDIFIPVLDGLSLVHQAGFIHRDIKPSNIYIREDHTPVLLDFGSARQTNGHTRTLTSLVTYGYAPFEQYNEGHDKQGPWTDIYSLGASLYYGITKRKPEDALKRGGSILSGVADSYQPVSVIAKGKYSENFLLAIDNALRFRAEDRPQDALIWADMLLGKTKALRLLQEAPVRQPPADDADRTVIMPPDYYKKRDTGEHSKPPTGRLIDASGRRVTGEYVKDTSVAANAILETNPPVSEYIAPDEPPTVIQATAHKPAYWIPKAGDSLVYESIASRNTASKKPFPKIKVFRIAAGVTGLLAVLTVAAVFAPMPDFGLVEKIQNSIGEEKPALDIPVLLTQAQKDFTEGRLVEPKGDNAAFRYLQVLQLEPGNQQAGEGIKKIAAHFAVQVKGHLKRNELQQAEAALAAIRGVAPDLAVVAELRQQVDAAKDSASALLNLLIGAAEDFNASRLTEPEQDNALAKYQRALRIDPHNDDAKQGIRNIYQHYLSLAEQNLAAGETAQARQNIAKLNLVIADSSEARRLAGRLNEVENKEARVAWLLEKAEAAYAAGDYVEPKEKNAFYYYNEVLKSHAENHTAKKGIQDIINYHERQFNKHLAASDFVNAQQMAGVLNFIAPNSRIADDVAAKLERQWPPNAISGELAGLFKKYFETYDIEKLRAISEFKPGRELFVAEFFQNYRSFEVSIANLQYLAKEQKAVAKIILDNLVNKKGKPVTPGTWSKFEITIQKNNNHQWGVYW
ncbi:MAG TPA: protein kinase [Gammaproteobacteria bacterium]